MEKYLDEDSNSFDLQFFSKEFNRINQENAELWVRLMLAEREVKSKQYSKSCSGSGSPYSDLNIKSKNMMIQKCEVAKRLNKSTRWVENYCKSGIIPFIKIGRSVFFNWDDVTESLEANSSVRFLRKH